MAKLAQFRRLFWLALLLGAGFLSLGYRLVDLQVVRHEDLSRAAQKNTRHLVYREPRRGDIRDARGNLLATSLFVKTVCADPMLLGKHQVEVARVLAPLLQTNESWLVQRLLPRTNLNDRGELSAHQSVVLKHKVSVEDWEKIQTAMKGLSFGVDEGKLQPAEKAFYRNLRAKAVFADAQDDQLRLYPNQRLAAHVLGYVGSSSNGMVGIEGVESKLNEKLSGARGWRQLERDGKGRELVGFREQDVEPRDGLNVVLTIDSGIQNMVERALVDAMQKHSPLSASAIAVRPRTGEILAMATLPDFDPNTPGGATPEQRRNRVISDMAEPGSTFKIVVVSGALNDQTVTLNDKFDCDHGRFVFAGKTLHDHLPYDVLTVEEIITKSSNIGAAKVGIKMGPDALYHYMRDFGFGQRTGIPLSAEIDGMVHPVSKWNKLSISRIPMGHEVTATPLQMVMAMSAIANHGTLMRPMLVSRLEDSQGRVVVRYQPQSVRQVVNEAAARQMVQALKTVVTPAGTAAKAHLEHYTVAGKTGTAQKAGNGGYLAGKYFSSFIGFFPADDPEICISVVLDEPRQGYYGGLTAAPVFHAIAERAANYLNVRPDATPSAALMATGPVLATPGAD